MHDDSGFLRALQADPDDDVTRSAYADWLEEQGDPRGEFLRAELDLAALQKIGPSTRRRQAPLQARLRQLRPDIPAEWLARVERAWIENCNVRFRFECPKRWENLRPTDSPLVRSCDACRKNVYYCESVREARRRAERGECVAIDVARRRTRGDLGAAPRPRARRMGRVLPRNWRGRTALRLVDSPDVST